jgi:ABC-type branched-subunit amino acid transport system ATPase component
MNGMYAESVLRAVKQARGLYHKLVLLIAPTGAGKTFVLNDVHAQTGAPLVNVNLELSRHMLELTERQRALQLPRLLAETIAPSITDLVLLDNVEVLFDVSLKQDPLRVLQGLSRSRTVVATWSGSIVGENLIYAMPDHAEYKKYPMRDFITVRMETTA